MLFATNRGCKSKLKNCAGCLCEPNGTNKSVVQSSTKKEGKEGTGDQQQQQQQQQTTLSQTTCKCTTLHQNDDTYFVHKFPAVQQIKHQQQQQKGTAGHQGEHHPFVTEQRHHTSCPRISGGVVSVALATTAPTPAPTTTPTIVLFQPCHKDRFASFGVETAVLQVGPELYTGLLVVIHESLWLLLLLVLVLHTTAAVQMSGVQKHQQRRQINNWVGFEMHRHAPTQPTDHNVFVHCVIQRQQDQGTHDAVRIASSGDLNAEGMKQPQHGPHGGSCLAQPPKHQDSND